MVIIRERKQASSIPLLVDLFTHLGPTEYCLPTSPELGTRKPYEQTKMQSLKRDYAPKEETDFDQTITRVNVKVLLGQILRRRGSGWCPTQPSEMPFTCWAAEPIPRVFL